jgi:drug/metabolite transporter (DMT)-like permease
MGSPHIIGAVGPREADDSRSGILYMLLGVAGLSAMDALGKKVVSGWPVFQVLAIRSTVALVLLTVALGSTGALGSLRTRQPVGHALRALCGLLSFVCFYAALRHLPLADAVAIAFGSPFLATVLARVILKEPVGARRWVAILAGFAGMLIIVRPGESALRPAALLVLASGTAYAFMMVLARRMTRPERPHESTASFVFYMLALQSGVGWLVAADGWKTPDAPALAQMAAMGVLGILGNYGLAHAFRTAPVATVAPFEYTGLLWGVLLGALVFGDVPTPAFWMGAGIIVAAGLYTARGDAR